MFLMNAESAATSRSSGLCSVRSPRKWASAEPRSGGLPSISTTYSREYVA